MRPRSFYDTRPNISSFQFYEGLAKRGRQANLSFFAFTATPKHKTLAVFGRNRQPAYRVHTLFGAG